MAEPRKRPRLDKKNLTIRRLSTYLRTLDHLDKQGVHVISSSGLERLEGVTQSLVRRDLAEFGTFGVRGVGYEVALLRKQISEILGFTRHWRIVLIGAVGLGSVFLHSDTFRKRKLEITQIFDSDPGHVGGTIEGIPVLDIANLETELDASHVDLAIIAVPPPETQRVINCLGRLGIRAALYFASRPVDTPADMIVLNMDITIELGVLTYHLHHQGTEQG